jgi:putative CRISPR-associated protein (TIGR02619 family)
MKKVITMVGTSLFENYLEKHSNDTNFKTAYNYFKNNRSEATDLDRESNRKKNIEKSFNERYFKNNQNASAEIKSLIKLKEELNEELEIYLLYSDTALSRLAAEIIHKCLDEYRPYDELKDCEIKKPIKIEKLQVWNRSEFNNGMVNLIQKIEDISQGYWENVIINITGGYKATIPYLTILAQVNRCPIYYIFEDTDALIKIPYIPIDINWDIFDKYWKYFERIAPPNFKRKDELSDNYNFLKECNNLYEETKIDNITYVTLGPIGEILWRKYKSRFFIFYAPEEVYDEIQRQDNIMRILTSKFGNNEIRKNKTEIKNGHCVYDDGNNPYRIFYFEHEGKIYIYKTFENHKEYEAYLTQTKINENFRNQIIEKSKIYKIRKEGQDV